MGFFFTKQKAKRFTDVDLLHRMGCKLCPLYNTNAQCKDMKPSGSEHPDVLILGQAPGETEDYKRQPFVGKSGVFLRSKLTYEQVQRIRFSNIVRTYPPGDREPTWEETECCRPSVENDILAAKPKAVFALGGLPLNWFLNQQIPPSINTWRGHRFPAQIGDHKFWVFPMLHPAYLLRGAMHLEHVFELDIKNAYKFLARKLEPLIIDPATVFDGCQNLYSIPDIRKALSELTHEARVAIDIETTPYRPYDSRAKILSISIGTKNHTIAFGWKHPQAKWSAEEFNNLYRLVHVYLKNKRQIKVAHNEGFEIEHLVKEFNDPEIALCNWQDTMSEAFNLGYGGNAKSSESGEEKLFSGEEKLFKGLLSLDNLIQIYFGFFLKSISNLDRTKLERVPLATVLKYNCSDTKFTEWLKEKIHEDTVYEGLESIVAEHDRRIPGVVLMQRQGLVGSEERAKGHASRVENQLLKIHTDIYSNPDVVKFQSKYSKFNVGTPADVTNLFDKLGYNVLKTDNRGNVTRSSDDTILKPIDHPVAKQVLEFRELSRLKSTYIDILIPNQKKYIIYPDGLIHGEFTTHFTTTGRLSSKHPNLQNWPKRGVKKEIRDMIMAPPGYVMASCDYGQLEYRGLVIASQAPVLIEYVKQNRDIHSEWAIKIAKECPKRIGSTTLVQKWSAADITRLKDEDKLFKAFRDVVKNNWVFASLYGAGPEKLKTAMQIPMDSVMSLREEFWLEFAEVKKWHQWAYQFYKEHGYIETLTKRRRYAYVEGGEIINMPIQGLAADIVMNGMNKLVEYAVAHNKHWFIPVCQIHDDLTFYLPQATWRSDLAHIVRTMLTCDYDFVNIIPLSVEASAGLDWAHQAGVGTYTSDKLDQVIIPDIDLS
jgi:uracil-DNA glycosylase family 4